MKSLATNAVLITDSATFSFWKQRLEYCSLDDQTAPNATSDKLVLAGVSNQERVRFSESM